MANEKHTLDELLAAVRALPPDELERVRAAVDTRRAELTSARQGMDEILREIEATAPPGLRRPQPDWFTESIREDRDAR